MKKACVIGWPIAHSRSPIIHNYWIKQYNINALYTQESVHPTEIFNFLNNLKNNNYIGCNVTIPHKEKILEITKPDEIAKRIGAANTIFFQNGNLLSTNTDSEGFLTALKADAPKLKLKGSAAMILGAGGAARAVINALHEAGVTEIRISNRTPERVFHLIKSMNIKMKFIGWHEANNSIEDIDILVNTTSLGMQNQPKLNFCLDKLSPKAVVSDLVYIPLKTDLIKQAELRGNIISNGLGMLMHQAVRGFSLWFGNTPIITQELRILLENDIKKHLS